MFNFFGPDINKEVKEFKNTENAVLVDVREEDEYAMGRIPGSINAPLSRLNRIQLPEGKLYVYCHSGGRSAQAASYLKRIGRDAKNIGGIASYKGPIEK